MRTTRVGLGITERQWQAFVADIGATLEHVRVPEREAGGILGPNGDSKTGDRGEQGGHRDARSLASSSWRR